ncbi:LamG-like jellyroll fold domain-containing protein [Flavobacterium sp. ZB4P13]|uniref:LamG-like jellyroll fold domain-containing protein n=1 Tax=Flavobacterium sp. ZB4P13 TaxID=3401728 RepID=UPI003AAECA9F
MKQILLSVSLFILLPILSYGQGADTYSFSASTRSYNALSGTDTSLGTNDDDAISSAITLPFSFTFAATAYTQIKVSSNGFISFGAPGTQFLNSLANAAGQKPFLFSLWDDLQNRVIPRYIVTGTAPNRIFKVEWSQQEWDYNSNADVISFQVWLYETTNVIEYVYNQGASVVNNGSASIGIYDANDKYLTLNNSTASPTAQSSTFTTNISTKPQSGQVYTWTPCTLPIVYAMTGAGGSFCSTLAGSPIGLANSETGVSYQLLRGSVAVGSAIAGATGSAISFGIFNTTGTYTVLATRNTGGCTATMSGNVQVNTWSTPPVPTATTTAVTCPSDTTGAITITNSPLSPASLTFLNADNDYIDFGTTLLSNRSAFTAEAWIKFDKTKYVDRMSLFGQNDVVEFGFESNNLRCWTAGGGTVDLPLTLYPSDNAWHHIAVVANGTNLLFYLDGVQVASGGSFTANYGSSAYTTKIGWGVMDVGGVGLTGEVFKLGFWSKALSPTEITNMASGFIVYDASQTGLLAGYNFNEGAGTTVSSVGSVAPSGTFNSSPVWTDPYVYSWTSTPAGFTSSTKNLTGLSPRTYNLTTSLKGCTQSGSWTVNAINTVPAITTQPVAPAATCSGSGIQTMTVVATGSGLAYSWRKDSVPVVDGGVISGQGTATLTLTSPLVANAGSYDVIVSGTCTPAVTSSPVTVTVSSTPVAPTLPTFIILCTDTAFTVNWTAISNATGYRLDVATDAGFTSFVTGYQDKLLGNVVSDNVTGLTPGATYYVRLRALNTCGTSVNSNVITVSASIATYTGTWSSVPDSSKKVIFANNYSGSGSLAACSCQVNSGVTVTIGSGDTLKLENGLDVLGTGTLIFENNASLVQTNDVTNSGNITYKRQTTSIDKFDYIYWSSPVSLQTLYDVSPNTLSDKYFSFDADADDWKQENPATVMVKGIGYIIRGPQNYGAPMPPGLYEASFKGTPNNGGISIAIPFTGSETSNLIGNPYPSALDADLFLAANNLILDGTLYFWTHNTNIDLAGNISNPGSGIYAYSSDDYASYNLTGGTGTAEAISDPTPGNPNDNKPSGKIAAGQAFFATGIAAGNASFNNSMRVSGGALGVNNSQFFKVNKSSKTTNGIEKHRIWLNLTNDQGAFKQTLVGYVTNATNGYDNAFDGQSFDGNEFVDFYSVNEDKSLTIQGRALPFDENDEVLLGYSSTIAGIFSIGIDTVDGLLSNKNVFIEDKITNSIKNLKLGAYSFSTVAGTFNDRFVLHYKDKTLGTGDFETADTQIMISVKNSQIKVDSPKETIDKVLIFDLLGKQIYKKISIGNNEHIIPNLASSEQALVVKVVLQNGQTVSRKIIY